MAKRDRILEHDHSDRYNGGALAGQAFGPTSTGTTVVTSGGASVLDELGDVNTSTTPPADGDVLTYDSASGNWLPDTATASVAELDDVGDVNAATPSDGDVLTWDSTPGEWVALAPTGGSALTVEEVDGSPTDSAVTKIVFPNGTLGIASHVATYTPAGGGSGAATAIRYPVQAVAGASTSSLTRAVTIAAASTINKLMVVTLNEGTFAVSSIACTNVTFTKIAGTTIGTAPVIEIWIGTVSGSPSGTTVTVTFAGTTFCNATVMEWPSLAGTLDTSASRNVSTDATGQHPMPLLTPGNTGSVVIAAASTTNNSLQFSAFAGPYFVFATLASTLGVAWGFPGTNPVYGIFTGGSSATACGITASIL